MHEKKLAYIERLAECHSKKQFSKEILDTLSNDKLLNDLLFYYREARLQHNDNDPLLTRSYGRRLNADRKLIMEPAITRLFSNYLGVYDIKYQDDAKFAICLTHDVDHIYPPIHHTALSLFYCLKALNPKRYHEYISWNYKGKEYSPYINFSNIMDVEEKYNAKSSFYFLATESDIKGSRYEIEVLENELCNIMDKDWEIGLHGGYYTFNNLDNMKLEKKRLEQVLGTKISGYRNHYLQFKIPDTWELLSKAGFKYDTTFGYNDMVGFRNGICCPFNPFNIHDCDTIDILEIPLNIMDSSLFGMAKSPKDAWDITKKCIDMTERYQGTLTLLWHNNTFNNPFRDTWSKLYEKILRYCNEKNAWMTSANMICRNLRR